MTDESNDEQPSAALKGAAAGPGVTPPPSSALRPLARLAVGRSGADIECMVREARRTARRAGRSLNWSDLVEVLGCNRPEPMRWRMAVHEAAHALVHLAVSSGALPSSPLRPITATPCRSSRKHMPQKPKTA